MDPFTSWILAIYFVGGVPGDPQAEGAILIPQESAVECNFVAPAEANKVRDFYAEQLGVRIINVRAACLPPGEDS